MPKEGTNSGLTEGSGEAMSLWQKCPRQRAQQVQGLRSMSHKEPRDPGWSTGQGQSSSQGQGGAGPAQATRGCKQEPPLTESPPVGRDHCGERGRKAEEQDTPISQRPSWRWLSPGRGEAGRLRIWFQGQVHRNF